MFSYIRSNINLEGVNKEYNMNKAFLISAVCLLMQTQVLAQAEQTKYKTVENVIYLENPTTEYAKERCRLDIYYPTDVEDYATIVWFHGGGLKAGNKHISDLLKEKGVAVVAVNYRLHPKVKAPVYIEDAAAATAWTMKHIAEYGGDPNKVFVSGHSAGGYLTSMIGLDKSYLAKHDIDANDLAGLIPFSGHTITHFTVRAEMGIDGKQVVVDKYAPIHHIRNDSPPYIIITGDREEELLGRYEENAYMYRMMLVNGHEQTKLLELDGFNHGEMARPAYHLLVQEIREILKKRKNN